MADKFFTTKYGVVFTYESKLLFSFNKRKNNTLLIDTIVDIAPKDGKLYSIRNKINYVNILPNNVFIFNNYLDAKLFYEVR